MIAELRDRGIRLHILAIGSTDGGVVPGLMAPNGEPVVSRLDEDRLREAGHVVVTIPDPRTAQSILKTVRQLAPDSFIIARSRYHMANQDLRRAGADLTVDEEQTVGISLANKIIDVLRESNRGDADVVESDVGREFPDSREGDH